MWWFGGSQIRYAKRSGLWASVRAKHLEEHPCCAACGSCLKPEVHHIVPVHLDPDRELDPDNLITLCDKYCHLIFGHLMNYKSYNKNVVEDAKVYYNRIKHRPL